MARTKEFAIESNSFPSDSKKLALLLRLRRIDREGNFISPLLSVIEGEHGRPDTVVEKEACLKTEAKALRKFFKEAKTDSKHLLKNRKFVAQIFTNPAARGNWVAPREAYLLEVSPSLVQKTAVKDRPLKQREMLKLAVSHGLPASDPLVVLSLACLYGGDAARDLLKPRRPNGYNVLSDLGALTYQAYARGMLARSFEGMQSGPKFEFVTGDAGLEGVAAAMKIVAAPIGDSGEAEYRTEYRPGLFGDLDEEASRMLLEELCHPSC